MYLRVHVRTEPSPLTRELSGSALRSKRSGSYGRSLPGPRDYSQIPTSLHCGFLQAGTRVRIRRVGAGGGEGDILALHLFSEE